VFERSRRVAGERRSPSTVTGSSSSTTLQISITLWPGRMSFARTGAFRVAVSGGGGISSRAAVSSASR
jgi:hypothetical protein